MAASKLHKHSRTCYTAEWPYCPFAILWLQPSVVDPRKVEEKLKKKQKRQKKYYDVGSRVLPSLQHAEMVLVQVGDQWKEATVKTQVTTPVE